MLNKKSFWVPILLFCLCLMSNNLIALPENERKIIEDLLGREIFTLYKEFKYLKIEKDNEYADLQVGEQYWLVVDSRHEYLTLRTMNKIVVEMIVRNPDLETKKGVKVGDTLKSFLGAYPESKRLTHYQTGVVRKGNDFFIDSENAEINFGKEGTVEVIILKNIKA